MSSRVVLDTDAVIDIMHGRFSVGNRVAAVLPDDVSITAMTLAELQFGSLRSSHPENDREEVSRFVERVQILPFDDAAASIHAQVRYALRSQPVGLNDLIIAATTMAADALLVSSNLREFSRVPGLRVESWR